MARKINYCLGVVTGHTRDTIPGLGLHDEVPTSQDRAPSVAVTDPSLPWFSCFRVSSGGWCPATPVCA